MESTEREEWRIGRRSVLKTAATVGVLGSGLIRAGSAVGSAQSSGGPVVLMGIDAEDGGPGGHGPIANYESVITDILGNVTNGGSGILVIGAHTGSAMTWWDQVDTDMSGTTVTYVSGATDISNVSFAGYAMLGVVSSYPETDGGMTQAENDALVARAADVAAFVNGGGGLLGFSQTDFTNAWAYVGGLGSFSTVTDLFYSDIDPTTEGTAIGVTDILDVTAWHDTFTAWPAFLDVLAWRNGYTDVQAAALGGAQVVLGVCSETYDLCAGQDIPVGTLTIEETAEGFDVTYETTDGWTLTETHLDVGDEFDDFHTTNGKHPNPRVGEFDYGATHDHVTSYTYEITMDDDELDDVASDPTCVLFAAHAAVEKVVDDTVLEETAWVCESEDGGVPFNDGRGGNWATYVEFCYCANGSGS